MKKIIFSLLCALPFIACSEQPGAEKTVGLDKDSVAYEKGYYGEQITEEGALSIPAFLKAIEGKDSLHVKLSGTINAVCKKKGCWMTVDLENGEEMRVRFKDYAFFVPMNADGMTTVFEGWAYVDTLSVAEQQHYLKDANATEEEIAAVTAPLPEFSFLASGVIIIHTPDAK